MFNIREMTFQIAALAAVITVLYVVPVSAVEVAAGPQGPVSVEGAVVAKDRDAIPAGESTAAEIAQPKPKTVRVAPPPPALPKAIAAVSRNSGKYCFGFWCAREFVLMLGVAY